MTYIKGIAAISPQQSFGNNPFNTVVQNSAHQWQCLEPDYSEWIDPKAIRRMSKIIRTGVAAAALALKDAGIEKPDAIIAGTGLGCVTDTTQFLTKLVENNEVALNPTPFMQSTHNTIASQIALLLQCLGYNQTYSQRGFSFENALQDALLLLEEKSARHVIVGGVDEATDVSTQLFDHVGFSNVTHGEGAAFFLLTDSPAGAWAKVAEMQTAYKPKSPKEVALRLDGLLDSNKLTKEDIDLIFLGACGDLNYDSLMLEAVASFSTRKFLFKELCGEYSTASSFALWLAAMAIKKGFVPGDSKPTHLKTVLIYNHYFNQHHSLILLKAC